MPSSAYTRLSWSLLSVPARARARIHVRGHNHDREREREIESRREGCGHDHDGILRADFSGLLTMKLRRFVEVERFYPGLDSGTFETAGGPRSSPLALDTPRFAFPRHARGDLLRLLRNSGRAMEN